MFYQDVFVFCCTAAVNESDENMEELTGNRGEEQVCLVLVEEGQDQAGSERATQAVGVGNAFNNFVHYCLVIHLYIHFS